MVKINGSILQACIICQRQAWLLAHQITPDQQDMFLEIGRLINNESFKREKHEVSFDGFKIDLLHSSKGEYIVGEIKKSSKAIEKARVQIGFYLLMLNRKGVKVKGELLFPKEKKRIKVILDERLKKDVIDAINISKEVINMSKPPKASKISYCKKCAYCEFCWS